MTQQYLHGVSVEELDDGNRPISTVSTAVIGFVATGDDADADFFPENGSTLITDMRTALDKAGDSGTLPQVFDAIKDQTNAVCVVSRVTSDADADAQTGLAIGGNVDGKRTGLQALLAAKTNHGVTPRIIGAPGLDNQAMTTELVTIAQALRGFTYAKCHGATVSEAIGYRGNFDARELMLIDDDFTGFDSATSSEKTLYATARALGLRAKIDNDIGWHKSISNVAVNGVTGTELDRSFDLMSAETDANMLNENHITTLIRENGFKFWGSRTCSADSKFIFENYTRTAQVLIDTLGYSQMWAIDKPLSPGLASDIIDNYNNKLKELTTQGYLLGGEAWFDSDANTPEVLSTGNFYVDYDYTPVPPLEQLHNRQRFTGRYLANFAERIRA